MQFSMGKRLIIIVIFSSFLFSDDTVMQLKEKCTLNNYKACYKIGELYYKEKDFNTSVKFLTKACDGGYANSCLFLSNSYGSGIHVDKNTSRALLFEQKACLAGESLSCIKIGQKYEEDKDYSHAILYYKIAYDFGSSMGHYHIAEINLYALNNKKNAMYYYISACNGGAHTSCLILGGAYGIGNIIDKNIELSRYYYKKACNMKNTWGCFMYGMSYLWIDSEHNTTIAEYEVKKIYRKNNTPVRDEYSKIFYYIGKDVESNTSRAQYLYGVACEHNASYACTALVENGSTDYIEEKPSAIKYYKKICTEGNFIGCKELGILYIEKKEKMYNPLKSIEFFKRACDLNDSESCVSVACLYEIRNDYKNSLTYNILACDKGDNMGCHNLAVQYVKGENIKKSYRKAKELFKQACNKGLKPSCQALEGIKIIQNSENITTDQNLTDNNITTK